MDPHRSQTAVPRHRWRPLAIAALAPCLALAGTGCTTVVVEAGDGRVAVEQGFGFVTIRPSPGDTAMVLHSTTLGWQAGPMGQAAGFSTARLTLLPPGCHLVLVDGAGADWPEPVWEALLRQGVCRSDDPRRGEPR